MILCFGGEMGFFVPSTADVFESSSAVSSINPYDSTYARCATLIDGHSAYAESPDIGSTLINAWCHFELTGSVSADSAATSTPIFEWLDDAGTARIRISYERDTDILKVFHYNGSWVQVGSNLEINLVESGGTPNKQVFDLHVICNNANGAVRLYTSGTERINVTLDTTAIDQLNKARWFSDDTDLSSAVSRMHISQVVIADETTIGMKVMTVYPSGDGNDTAWTNTYTSIDEIAYSDGDGINTTTADQVENFAGTLMSTLDGHSIRAVCVTARARRGETGPQNLQLCLRIGSTNYFSSTQSLDVAFGNHIYVWENNPATLTSWQASDLASGTTALFQFGVKSIA